MWPVQNLTHTKSDISKQDKVPNFGGILPKIYTPHNPPIHRQYKHCFNISEKKYLLEIKFFGPQFLCVSKLQFFD